MKLWKGNRIDAEYELSNVEIAEKFIASEYFKKKYELYGSTDKALVWFIGAKDGLNSTWEWDEKKGSIDGSIDVLEILNIIDKKNTKKCLRCNYQWNSMRDDIVSCPNCKSRSWQTTKKAKP
jgi:hypothetical protein